VSRNLLRGDKNMNPARPSPDTHFTLLRATSSPAAQARASKALLRPAIGLSMILLSLGACAQSAGSWQWKLGVNTTTPSVSGGQLSAPSLPNTLMDVKSASSLIFTATYFWRENWSLEVFAGLPYEHDVVGDGAIAGAGKLGSVKQLSPTVIAQYRFGDAKSALRPYVGVGLSYAYFYGEKGSAALTALTNPGGAATKLSVDAAWGVSAQLGASFKLGQGPWFIDASAIKTQLKAKTRLSSGQTAQPNLDPLSVNLSIGRPF
jgi:outer membrane protein